MPDKSKLADMLNTSAAPPSLRRGQGVKLSTDIVEAEQKEPQNYENAQSHKIESAEVHKDEPLRINRGYRLREDLVTELKVRAVRTHRPLYELMEEAIEQYLAQSV